MGAPDTGSYRTFGKVIDIRDTKRGLPASERHDKGHTTPRLTVLRGGKPLDMSHPKDAA